MKIILIHLFIAVIIVSLLFTLPHRHDISTDLSSIVIIKQMFIYTTYSSAFVPILVGCSFSKMANH